MNPVTLIYTNYRGEESERTITPQRVWYGSTEWHPEPQWLMTAFDHEKQANRDFALKDFGYPAPYPRAQALEELPCDVQLPGVILKRGVNFSVLLAALKRRDSWPDAARALSSHLVADEGSDLERYWRPISEADKSITFNQDFDLGDGEKMTIRNSDDYWVRDDDGRVYRATWSDQRGGYWWDIEGESPVDPFEYMPHPLSLPASPGASE